MKVNDDDILLAEFLSGHGDVGVRPSLKDGTVVGGWRVTGFLGRGGSAEVYCAKNEATGEVAALKMLHRLEQRHVERFSREADFLRDCSCEFFPHFIGAGVYEGRPYMALELLEPMEPPKDDSDVANYVCAVARGLDWLHVHGYVHRDVKPRNILARPDGTPVIIDLGLLKKIGGGVEAAADQLSVVDGHEVGVGTPRYAAPEQFSGGDATPAMDIHALGRLAYDCFDGKPTRAWEKIIRRATSSIPGQRFQNAGDFIRAVAHRNRIRNVFASFLGVAAVACIVMAWISFGGHERVKWAMSCECVSTNVVTWQFDRTVINTNVVKSGGREFITCSPVEEYVQISKEVKAAIVRLEGDTNVYKHPLHLDPSREYWIIGPGTLDATIENSKGAMLRLDNCVFVNRSRESLAATGVSYTIYQGALLDLPNISRRKREELGLIFMSTVPLPYDNSAWTQNKYVPVNDEPKARVRYFRSPKEIFADLEAKRKEEEAVLEVRKRQDDRR